MTEMHPTLTDSKEVGLAVGLILGEHLLGMRDLHYGLWTDELSVELPNFPKAQENYTEFILSHIPQGVRRILDVGSGAGKLSGRLVKEGYQVDCVSPSVYLTARLREVVGDKSRIYQVKFEELSTSDQYDLVLFSESFQYVELVTTFAKLKNLVAPGKHIIISDFFRKNIPGTSPLGGGHNIDEFLPLLHSSPFEILKQIDLTEQTAPTMEMFGNVLNNAALPLRDLICGFIQHRHPFISKFLAWKLKRRFNKINDKYFSKKLSGNSFAQFKTYRFFLLQRSFEG